MVKNRVKIDINDKEGNRLTISLEGRLTRDKMLQILDFVDLFDGASEDDTETVYLKISKFKKTQNVILRKFPIGWFSSQEVMIAYEDVLDEPIGLSTVSTYLTRLSKKGFLIRAGSSTKIKYKVVNFIKGNNRTRYKISP